jgi:PAS domain S-box-containing protein
MTTLTVLLVDDNPDDRALVERELKNHIDGVQVEHAGDAEALADAMSRNGFDLVVTDYRLRWSTGTEVLRELKRRFPGKPVIMFTGSGNEEVAVSAMKEGLDDYITKTVKHYPRVPYAVLACVDRARQREQLAQALERETLAKVRLEIALQSARMSTWQVDLVSNSVLYSPAIGPLFGQSREHTRATFEEWLEAVHSEDRASVMTAWEAAMAGDGDYASQFRANGGDGELRWIASSGKVIRDGHGLPKLVIGTARDITDEVGIREQLLRQQEELQTILNVLPVGVAISHDPQAKSTMFTPYLANLLEVEPGLDISAREEEIARRPFKLYRNGVAIEPEDLPMQQAARSGMDVRGEEIEVRLADGRMINLLVNTSPLKDKAGRVRGAVGALMDVTALKRTQRELETANQQKTEFLSVLSHELRNPMAAIAYSSELLRHVGSPEMINKARAVIERQSAHMGKLLDELLDLSRITRDKVELDLKPMDLRHVIEIGYESARSLIEPLGHTVSMSLPAEPIVVLGDEVRLTQVVANILGNAAKFTLPGGRIDIRAMRVGDTASVEISDNGIGIEPDKLHRIFEMFFQEQSKSGGGTTGLGIGLAVVHKLVDLHGGAVRAHSDGVGQGTRLLITLPAQCRLEAGEPARESASASGRHGTILVADDNVDAADLLGDVLRSEGHTVLTAYDGRSAIEMATQSHPDLAILDIGMPFATGNDVARWIREQPWGGTVTLVAVTGWGQTEDRKSTREAGFDFHLVKPVYASQIARLISEALFKTSKGQGAA